MTGVLELRGVHRHYEGPPPVRALDGVDLSVHRGELVGVFGASGSGKSTLLHLAGALDRPTEGEVLLDDAPISALGARGLARMRGRHVGFVFQDFQLLPELSALENVALGLQYRGVPRRQRTARARDALDRVGLADLADRRPGQLSGGQCQRVSIARALVGDPPLLLADEPTGNLDSVTGEQVVSTLAAVREGHRTVVIVTHDRSLASRADRVVELRDGRVVRDVAGSDAAPLRR